MVRNSLSSTQMQAWLFSHPRFAVAAANNYLAVTTVTPYQNDAWDQWTNDVCTQYIWHQWATVPYRNLRYAGVTPPSPPPQDFTTWFQNLRECDRKSVELLRQHLTPVQVAELESHDMFHLQGDSGRTYRFTRDGAIARLLVVPDSELPPADLPVDTTFCIHPDDRWPPGDRILTCKLLLQHNEQRFLRTANATVIVPEPQLAAA